MLTTVLVRWNRKTMSSSSSLLLLLMLMTSFTIKTTSADDARIATRFLVVSPPSLSFCRARLHVYSVVLRAIVPFCRACLHVYSVVY